MYYVTMIWKWSVFLCTFVIVSVSEPCPGVDRCFIAFFRFKERFLNFKDKWNRYLRKLCRFDIGCEYVILNGFFFDMFIRV